MRKQIQYTDEPLGDFRIVADFLPSPKDLKFKSENTKVTISLSSESIAYFKAEAKANHTQYQKMIRRLLDVYVARHKTQTKHYGVGEPRQSEIARRSIFCVYKGKEISIDDALKIRKKTNGHLSNETFKCVACKQPVRPHKQGSTGAAAHFEHRKSNDRCPLISRGRP